MQKIAPLLKIVNISVIAIDCLVRPCFLLHLRVIIYIMNYVRWYDKDTDLSKLMSFLEGLSDEIKDEIAQDLIQIILSEIKTNQDNELFQLSENKLCNYRRWYDNNMNLHSAIEIIKNLDSQKRKEIISLLLESIVQILAEKSNE